MGVFCDYPQMAPFGSPGIADLPHPRSTEMDLTATRAFVSANRTRWSILGDGYDRHSFRTSDALEF